MIVSAAVIDDMIALIILTQLEALTGTFSVTGVVVPIVSSIAILVLGGYIAIKILPSKFALTPFLNLFILRNFVLNK